MKILIVSTGGTISSRICNGVAVLGESPVRSLTAEYSKRFADGTVFDETSPYTILSENLDTDRLNLLNDAAAKGIGAGYDGIIVTHGTDTLACSAASLGFFLGEDCPPVVLVSANLPVGDPLTNAYDNFCAAVRLIGTGVRGVFVSYKNRGDRAVSLHRALRLLRSGEGDDSLFSVGGTYARFDTGLTLTHRAEPEARTIGNPLAGTILKDTSGVLTVAAVPGDDYRRDMSGTGAVLLLSFHSGTVPTGTEAFADFCRRAAEMKIPVFLPGKAGNEYETLLECEKLNITRLPVSSDNAVYFKLWYILSAGLEPQRLMPVCLAGEYAL